jgi:hypothetical protein
MGRRGALFLFSDGESIFLDHENEAKMNIIEGLGFNGRSFGGILCFPWFR